MRLYECCMCHGFCDPGELENGVCFECRAEPAEGRDEQRSGIIKDRNPIMRARYAQQADGQLMMSCGMLTGFIGAGQA